MFHNYKKRKRVAVGNVNLYIFPHAGASASYYYPLAEMLNKYIDPYILQLPGRAEKAFEDHVIDIDKLLPKIIDEIANSNNTEKPCMFYGHSMGAGIAFEVTRKLNEMNREHSIPNILFMSGYNYPNEKKSKRTEMSDKELVEYVKEISSTTDELLDSEDFRELFLPIIRADISLNDSINFNHKIRLSCNTKLVFFYSLGDGVRCQSVQKWGNHFDKKKFPIIDVPGDHFWLINNPSLITKHINHYSQTHSIHM